MLRYLIPMLAVATPSLAASLTAPLTGQSLTVESPCAKRVTITPDPGLHGQVAVQATADHPEEIDRLILESRESARIRTRDDKCYRTGIFGSQPTLTLAIRVPAGFPISVDEDGASLYNIGDVGGPLSLDVSGSAQLSADHATSLHVDISGAGKLKLGRVQGASDLDLSGSGQVEIAQADIPDLNADISGAGMIIVHEGQIKRVKLEDSGFGGARFGGETGDAQVEISGAGSVHFSKLMGELEKEVSGVGEVTLGR